MIPKLKTRQPGYVAVPPTTAGKKNKKKKFYILMKLYGAIHKQWPTTIAYKPLFLTSYFCFYWEIIIVNYILLFLYYLG
uniref:Uncharacterized protein n=1 Tax=Heterorhabditis bacteriophora TaxID=37862 RepID=A0A1I7X2H4_HETBA